MKKRLSYVSPVGAARVAGTLGLAYSLILGVVWTIAGSHNLHLGVPSMVELANLLPLSLLPVSCCVYGAIAAALYNLVAKLTGGFVFTMTDVEPPRSTTLHL